MKYRHSDKSRRVRHWLPVLLLALLAHIALLFLVKPSFFGIFTKRIHIGKSTFNAASAPPDAIIVLPIEIAPNPTQPPATKTRRSSRGGIGRIGSAKTDTAATADNETDLSRLLEGVETRTATGPSAEPHVIPPRPVEITWPDTKHLGHCLGRSVSVNIKVDENGEVVSASADAAQVPQDCLRAALQAARRIVFEPGRINGRPMPMRTRVRIDFREPDQ